MQIIALIPSEIRLCEQIREAMNTLPAPWEIHVEDSLLGLGSYLARRTPEGTPLVLMAEDSWVMNGLLALSNALSRFRILLILDTSDPEQVQQAHRLQPRVVIDSTDAAVQVPKILMHMKIWE